MRQHLEKSLEDLRDEIGRLGGMVEEAMDKTIIALKEMDAVCAAEIIRYDDEIDNVETRIERRCLSLFALQQPLARDLRVIGSSLKMITDLERIGDHAADIAEITLRLAPGQPYKINPDIYTMAGLARSMVGRSIEAFIHEDLKLASEVCSDDDAVDELFNLMIMDLVSQIKAGGQSVETNVDLMFIVKYFERIADHATNIAEWAVYNETGKHLHLQHPGINPTEAIEDDAAE